MKIATLTPENSLNRTQLIQLSCGRSANLTVNGNSCTIELVGFRPADSQHRFVTRSTFSNLIHSRSFSRAFDRIVHPDLTYADRLLVWQGIDRLVSEIQSDTSAMVNS